MGVQMKIRKKNIKVFKSKKIRKINIKTEPYPGFPTDLQAQIMILMTQAKEYQINILKIDLCCSN